MPELCRCGEPAEWLGQCRRCEREEEARREKVLDDWEDEELHESDV